MVRVFVVDDAPFIRKAMTRVLSADPEITVVGEACGGAEALDKIPRCKPDLVTLDVDMPEMDGLSTLRELRRRRPELPVIMMSALTHEGAATTLDALSQGAVDFIDKTRLNVMDFGQLSRELLGKIKAWEPGAKPRRAGTQPSDEPGGGSRVDWGRYDLCIVGASTGGPAAIERLARRWPADFPVPLVIVQHMPDGFTRPFAERLDGLSKLRVLHGRHGMRLERGAAVVAPAGKHLRIGRARELNLSRQPISTPHRPSIDVAMYSASCSLAAGAVAGVLLTGMGEDGAEGMYAIRERGGITIAEHERSCVVAGMPRAAYRRGAVSRYLPLDEIVDLFG